MWGPGLREESQPRGWPPHSVTRPPPLPLTRAWEQQRKGLLDQELPPARVSVAGRRGEPCRWGSPTALVNLWVTATPHTQGQATLVEGSQGQEQPRLGEAWGTWQKAGAATELPKTVAAGPSPAYDEQQREVKKERVTAPKSGLVLPLPTPNWTSPSWQPLVRTPRPAARPGTPSPSNCSSRAPAPRLPEEEAFPTKANKGTANQGS